MKARVLVIAATATVLGVIAAGAWRGHERNVAVIASIPSRPAFAGFPAELGQRVARCEQTLRRDPGTTAALAELAGLYHANGFLGEAGQCYRGLIKVDPREARWAHRLASIYAGYGELEAALALWEMVLARSPDYLPAQIRMGDLLLKRNREAEAAAAYAAAVRLDQGNPFALVGLARIDLAAQRWGAARTHLEQAAARSQGRIGADLLVTACEQVGDHERASALRARTKSSGSHHDPPDPWLDELMTDCYDAYRLTVAAGFAQHAGDPESARRLIDRALALAPSSAPALFQSGMLALARRDYDRARAVFETCVQVAPDFSDGWLQLLQLHVFLGNPTAAERTLAAGLRGAPASPALLIEFGSRQALAGRHAEALIAYEKALRLRPVDADTLVKLASVHFRLEQVNDGKTALDRALAAEPEFPAALTTLALHAIGRGDEAAARAWLQRVRQQERTPPSLVDELATAYRQRFGRAAW